MYCTLSVKLSDFTVWRHTWRKHWVNCAVLKIIAQASELSFPVVFHTENCAVHSGNPTVSPIYRPTPTMASSQGNQLQHTFLAVHSADEHRVMCSFSNTFLFHNLGFLFSFSDNIMANLVTKQQTTALFLSKIVTRTRRHTELPKKLTKLMGNL